jgi:hypothetical protein
MWSENNLTKVQSNEYIAASELLARKPVVIGAAGTIAIADETATTILGYVKEKLTYAAGEPAAILNGVGYEIMVRCAAADVTVGAEAVLNEDGDVVDSGTADAGTFVVGTILTTPMSIPWYERHDPTELTANYCRILRK